MRDRGKSSSRVKVTAVQKELCEEEPTKELRQRGSSCQKCWAWWEFRGSSTAWGTKLIQENPTEIFLVVLTKRAVAIMALRQGDVPMPQGPVPAIWLNGGPRVFWVSTPRVFPSFSYTKWKKGIWSLRCSRTGVFIKLSFKVLKAMLSGSSHKIGSRLLFSSKTYRGLAIREKFAIQF